MTDYISPSFDKAFPALMAVEGGWCDTPGDTGGETYKGISRNNWPSWLGWVIIDAYKSKGGPGWQKLLEGNADLQARVKSFYFENFWEPVRGPELDHRVAAELLDTAVNMGVKTAVTMLQDTLNLLNANGSYWGDLPLTGNFRDMTMAAVQGFAKRYGWQALAHALNLRQACRYFEILRANPTQEKFAWGWIKKRVLDQMVGE